MAGKTRIRTEDITLVRERVSLETVAAAHVSLKRVGANLVGLCPFHEEKTPSFTISPTRNLWYCFGCGRGGDVIKFTQDIENLDFVEAVEQLASIAGISLRYDTTPTSGPAGDTARGERSRLIDITTAACGFYRTQLYTKEAHPARQFLADRGFDKATAEHFGVGYAPRGWDALTQHLRQAGYRDSDILTAGLATRSSKTGRLVDRFRGRLIWPIRDPSGIVLGFGARKLYDDDTGPKYLNTPETPLFVKSQVLYGLDLARPAITRHKRIIVVEGYTDVMAFHAAGEPCAVATCGTAFGPGHVRLLRRLLPEDGEIIFAFDGDTAGQKAALRILNIDPWLHTRSVVAVAPEGMDPCELRLAYGNHALTDLLTRSTPLVEYTLRAAVAHHNLTTPEGRTNALHATAPILRSISNPALRYQYEQYTARLIGLPYDTVTATIRRAASSPRTTLTQPQRSSAPSSPAVDGPPRPDPRDPALRAERETLRLLVQAPTATQPYLHTVTPGDYSHPAYQAAADAIYTAFASNPNPEPATWPAVIQQHTPHPSVRALIIELAVDPGDTTAGGPIDLPTIDPTHIQHAFLAVAIRAVDRQITHTRTALGNPDISDDDMNALLAEAARLVARRNELATQASSL